MNRKHGDSHTILVALVLLVALWTPIKALPDRICSPGFYYDSSLTQCRRCSRTCDADDRPVEQCPCTACADAICGANCAPHRAQFDSKLKRCVSDDLIAINCTLSERPGCAQSCYRNDSETPSSSSSTTARANDTLCVCSSPGDGTCNLVINTLDGPWCPQVRYNSVVRVPTSTQNPASPTSSASLDFVEKLNSGLIGVIVAVACIGVVIVSTAVILVVGISLHNRFVVWGQIRELRRLRREREERERRRRAVQPAAPSRVNDENEHEDI